MANLSYGSKGNEVKKLQEELNKQGYKLDVDGIYGSKTQAAVKDYQKKNNLSVDGIVGAQTSGALYKTPANVVTPQATTQATTQAARPSYTPSNELTKAKEAVSGWEGNKPSQYVSSYESQINKLLDDIINGEKFSYDVNADALYQQYKDQYTKLGERAMQDTMGQASALTGGYGSSYATTAGGEAYQNYLGKLLDKIPELTDAAYRKYTGDREHDKSTLEIIKRMEDDEYSKHRDIVSDYWSEGGYLWDKVSDMTDDEWARFLESVSQYNSDRDFAFNQSKFDYQKAQDEIAQENWQKEYESAQANASKKSSSGSSKSSASSSKNEQKTQVEDRKDMLKLFEKGVYKYPESYADFVMVTGYSGILTENEFSRRRWYTENYIDYKAYLIEMFKQYYLA